MSEPFVYVGGCEVSWLPSFLDGTFDHVITDPPYSEHTHTKQRRGATSYAEPRGRKAQIARVRELGFDAITDEQRAICAREFARIAKRWIIIFTDDRGIQPWADALETAGLEWVRTLVWRKVGSTPQFTGDRPGQGCEFMVCAHRPGKKRWNGGGHHGFYECPIVLNRGGTDERVHTTQKPLELMEALVRDFTDRGEMILDPFCGSGTTLVAALRHGRRCVGIEVDPGYAMIAEERARDTREQGVLF